MNGETEIKELLISNTIHLRYYYSIYFKGHSLEIHKRLFGGIVAETAPIFKDDADVESILHSVFTTLFNFGIRVYNGELENNDENRPHIFNVPCRMMMTYLKKNIQEKSTISQRI